VRNPSDEPALPMGGGSAKSISYMNTHICALISELSMTLLPLGGAEFSFEVAPEQQTPERKRST
jgi:hypothetical protein